MKLIVRFASVVVIAVVLGALGGCVSGGGADFLANAWADRASTPAAKPFVYLVVGPLASAPITSAAEQVTRDSSLFGGFTFDKARAERADYTIKLDYRLHEVPIPGVMLRGALAMATLGLANPCTPTKIALSAKVVDRSKQEIHSYQLSDSARGSMSTGCKPDQQEAVERLVRTLYEEISRDRIIPSIATR